MKILDNKPKLLKYLEKLEEYICNLNDANHGNQLLTFFNRGLGELRPAIDEMKRRESAPSGLSLRGPRSEFLRLLELTFLFGLC